MGVEKKFLRMVFRVTLHSTSLIVQLSVENERTSAPTYSNHILQLLLVTFGLLINLSFLIISSHILEFHRIPLFFGVVNPKRKFSCDPSNESRFPLQKADANLRSTNSQNCWDVFNSVIILRKFHINWLYAFIFDTPHKFTV